MYSREELEQIGDAISRVVTAKRADGTPLYSRAEIEHFLPLVILGSGTSLAALPIELQQLMQRFAVASGLDRAMTKEQIVDAVQRYYHEHPVAPGLLSATRRALRSHATSPAPRTASASWDGAQRFLPKAGDRPSGNMLAIRSK
jgi:hypothetical protein